MKSTKYIQVVLSSLFLLLFNSCSDYLDERPAKEGVLPEKISDLQNFYNQYNLSNKSFYRTFISDDATIPYTANDVEVNAGPYQKRLTEIQTVFFRRDLLRSNANGGKALWNSCNTIITRSNYILSVADDPKIKGTEQERAILKAYARFERAISNFDLVTSFSMPYAPGVNDNGIGIPIRTSYNYEINEANIKRRSLKESYDFIEQDILAAMADIPNEKKVWKITKAGVYAFAARFYLFIGNYDDALKYSNLALQSNNEIVDYTGFTTKQISLNNKDLNVLPYFNDVTFTDDCSITKLKDLYYVETMNIRGKPVFPSDELIALYMSDGGENDVRLLNMPQEAGVIVSTYFNVTSSKLCRYYLGYGINGGGTLITSPDVSEMVLTKAECLAEQGQLDEAKSELNRLRVKRIRNYDPSKVNNLSSKESVLNFIYDERRREKPFFLRGFDLRRLNAIKMKNIVVTKNFFEISQTDINPNKPIQYVLVPNDDKYADFINDDEIALCQPYLIQNP